MKKIKLHYWIVSFLILGCNMRIEKNQNLASDSSKYLIIQETIIKPKCLYCHSGSNASGDIDLSDYQSLMSTQTVVSREPEKSTFYTSVLSGKMPKKKTPLSAEQIQLIYSWIKEGALENNATEPTVETKPSSPQATFTWLNENIFQTRCVVCHNTARPRGKINFTNYETLLSSEGQDEKPITPGDSEHSTIYLETAIKKMPPKPRYFTAEEKKALFDWIAGGAPEVTPDVVLPPPGQPNPPQANFEWLNKNLFRRCSSCHGEPYKVAQVDFSTYTTLLASSGKSTKPLSPNKPLESGIYIEVSEEHMPPPQKTLSGEELVALKTWISEGAKNN